MTKSLNNWNSRGSWGFSPLKLEQQRLMYQQIWHQRGGIRTKIKKPKSFSKIQKIVFHVEVQDELSTKIFSQENYNENILNNASKMYKNTQKKKLLLIYETWDY